MPLTDAQVKALTAEVAKCDRLLNKLWAEDSRDQVLRRRRSLLRLLHGVPQMAQVPLNWAPPPHPQVSNLPNF